MELNTTTEEFLKRFRVFNPQTLFGPDFEMLRKFRCPVCSRKLYWRADKKIAFCKSKMRDKFFITQHRLLSLGGSLS